MTIQVETPETISLDGVEYPLKAGTAVRHVLASQYAPKIVVGDTSRDSQQRASVLTWLDWRDGMGLHQIEGSDDVNRSWFSTLNTRLKKHLVLAELVTITASSGQSGVFQIGAMSSYQGNLYAAHGAEVYRYSGTANNSWGSSVKSLTGAAQDSVNVTLGPVDNRRNYLVFATGDGYAYLNQGTWTDGTKPTSKLAAWDDKVWGLSGAGQLWYALTPGTEFDDARLPLHAGRPTGLFVGRGGSGALVLYAATETGLYVHDYDNSKWIETELGLPLHKDNGKGHVRWRDATFITSTLAMYKYVNGANNAVVTLAGPDLDHGVPAAQRGSIVKLVNTQNEIFALVDKPVTAGVAVVTVNSGAETNELALGFGGMSPHLEETTGTAWVGAYDDRGWRVVWVDANDVAPITSAVTSDSDGAYRLYFARNRRVYWLPLERNIVNPNEVTTLTFAASGTHETPWFDNGQVEVDKLALRVKAEVEDATTTEAVTVSFAINGSTSYTQFTDTYTSDSTFDATDDRIEGDGVTTFSLPAVATPSGTAFRSIRFKLDYVRGSTTTLSPDVISLTLEWRKKIPAQWAHQVTIDLDRVGELQGEASGLGREGLFDAIRKVVESNTLVRFGYRHRDANDSGDTDPYDYYVDVSQAQGMEKTGDDWGAEITLTLVEV